MKGMNEFLNVEAESSDGGDSDNNDNDSDNNGTGDARATTRGEDGLVRSPSPKCCWMSRGEPT